MFFSFISLWDGKDGTCLKTNVSLSDLKHSGVKVCVIQGWYYILVSLSPSFQRNVVEYNLLLLVLSSANS